MKVKLKPRPYKQLRDLAPGDLFRLLDSETIHMKLAKVYDCSLNTVNIVTGSIGIISGITEVIPVEGEFTEK